LSWRPHPFIVGARYRSKKDFPGFSGPLGEILVFEHDSYSRYDNCSGYEFRSLSGENRVWWLHDDEPMDSWREYFESIEP
jgi:hypothetical protein